MRPAVALVASLLLASCVSVLHEHWEGDPEEASTPKPRKKVATDNAGPPPVSFVVPPQGEEVEIAEEEAPPPTTSKPRPASDEGEEGRTPPPPADRRPHEIPISVESVSAPLLLHQGETDRYREPGGQPLAGGDQYGKVTTPTPAPAPAAVASAAPSPDAPSPPPTRKKHYERSDDATPPPPPPAPVAAAATPEPAPAPAPPPPTKRRAPVASEDAAPAPAAGTEVAPEPEAAPAPAPPPPPSPRKRRTPVASDDAAPPAAATNETPKPAPPAEEAPAPKPVEEPVQAAAPAETEKPVAETPLAHSSDDSAFINVPVEKPKKKKRKKSEEAPPPEVAANTADQPKPFDPFRKMDQDMATLEGPKEAPSEEPKASPPAPESTEAPPPPPPPRHKHKKPPAELAPAAADQTSGTGETRRTEVAEPPPAKPIQRDPKWIGFSITGGAGLLLASGARPGFTPALAYGGQIAWNPSFLGDFGLDLGYWRSSSTTGTAFESITSTDNDISARIFWLPQIGSGFVAGVGLGLLMTFTTSSYMLTGSSPGNAGALLPGGEGTVTVGYRVSYFEARIDVRALLRGGARIEFLPAASVGVTF